MYSWFALLTKMRMFRPVRHSENHSASPDIVNGWIGKEEPLSSKPSREDWVLFVYGLIEFLPLLIGGAVSVFANDVLISVAAIACGIGGTVALCILLRKRTPPQRIE